MSDFIGFLLCISPVVIIVGLVIYGIVFSKSHAVHDKRFIEKVTVISNSLNDDPQNEQLADSLIQICKDLKQVYAPRILLGVAFRQCDPLDAVFGLLMLKDTGELQGQIPVELLRQLRKVNGKTFPISVNGCPFLASQARRYFPEYPNHEKNGTLLLARVKGWKGLEKPQPVISRPKQEENIEGVAERSRSPQGIQGVNIDEGAGIAQWIYPSKLLSTPQSAFDFPEYPGLSVAMRLYIVVGKISWWLALLILVGFNIFYAVFTVGLGLLLTIPVSFLILLLMNLGLAFQFGSCEIVKVLIRIENNTRKETVNESGDE